MKRERIDIKPGDFIRCPDRATAAWHRLVRVGRHRDGSRFVVLRRSRFWRAFGFPPLQKIEWGHLKAMGYGIKRAKAAAHVHGQEICGYIAPMEGKPDA